MQIQSIASSRKGAKGIPRRTLDVALRSVSGGGSTAITPAEAGTGLASRFGQPEYALGRYQNAMSVFGGVSLVDCSRKMWRTGVVTVPGGFANRVGAAREPSTNRVTSGRERAYAGTPAAKPLEVMGSRGEARVR